MRSPAEISFAIACLFILSLPFWLAENHDHEQALLMRPGGIKADTMEICGDSAFVRDDYHRPIPQHTHEWLIIDKPE